MNYRNKFKSLLALSLLAGCLNHLSVAIAQPGESAVVPAPRDDKWIARHEGFLKDEEGKNFDVVFLGDSITDNWRGGGKKVWDERIARYNALNLGISGDRTQHVLWRIQKGEFDHIKPKVIVLMIGTNNTSRDRNTTPEVIEGVTAVVHAVQSKVPAAKILLLGIFPRGMQDNPLREKIKQINIGIAKLDDGNKVKYLDIGDKFLEPDGTLSKEIMPDLLHPSKKGYRIWADVMDAQLPALLK